MSLPELRKLRNDLNEFISEIEEGPSREIDIAAAHTGDPALIAEVVRVIGDKASDKWYQAERIFCSLEKCPNCPHGLFMYEYKVKRRGRITVRFKGEALDGLENIKTFRITDSGNIEIIDC